MVTVKRALLSCHDKTGLERFARALTELGVELVASGGTATFLRERGVAAQTVEAFAGITEQLDGRVKTLHPKIHAGILANRGDPAHVQTVGPQGLIDLVAVTLYPFASTVRRPGVSVEEAVEQVDIGGLALLRAAAKNFAHVAVVSEPAQYDEVASALRAGRGQLAEAMSRRLAVSAFRVTSEYDTAITAFLAADGGRPPAESAGLPTQATVRVRQRQPLRYGENPHQAGAWYVPDADRPWGLGTLRQLQGKELSYNNLLDADAALRVLLDFEEPACVVIKHAAPCGVATAGGIAAAYERAWATDPESAFGGIVGLNRPVDASLARRLTEPFLEVLLAPSVEAEAGTLLAKREHLRVVVLDWPTAGARPLEWRQLLGGWLLQEPDRARPSANAGTVATRRAPTERERADLGVAWLAVRHVRSNGIVLVKDAAAVGIGQGQPSRVGSVRLALERAGARAKQAVAASDGFFPFPDSLELLAAAGVTAVIQPGGSRRDAEVVEAANRAKLAMVMTGVRGFRH